MTHTEILEKLGTAVKKGLGIDESVLESLEEALLSSDVGADTAAALAERVRERASGSERKDLAGLREMLRSEIEGILATAPRAAARADVPLHVTFLVGVNGSGKTTTAAKLAAREKEAGRRVLLAAADTFRAGAIEQLQTWADRLGVPVIRHSEGADPSAVLFDALAAAKARQVQSLIVDTAGRLHTKKNLMEELAKMRRIAVREVPGAPHRTLLVLDATTGVNGLDAGAPVRGGRGRGWRRADEARRERARRHRAGDLPGAQAAGALRRRRRERRGSGSVRPVRVRPRAAG